MDLSSRIGTDASTKPAPASCTVPSRSPKAANAKAAVKAGSALETMLALEAPRRSTPAMNALVASTDEDSATAITRPMPVMPPRGASWP